MFKKEDLKPIRAHMKLRELIARKEMEDAGQ